MASTATVMHGRREGQTRNFQSELPRLGLMAQGINPKEVAVFQPKDWQRIQNSLAKYNEAAEKAEIQRRDREQLHAQSKELVKHWENTIEGQRLKKLQARKIREETEEIERKKIDIEEAKLQAEKRKKAIERAKQLQYYETDRVKGFHGALLLTEVLKERDAQITMKNAKINSKKHRDEHLLAVQKKNYEHAIHADQEKAEERFQRTQDIAKFQKLQIQDKETGLLHEKEVDTEEGKTIKQQFDTYEATKKVIVAQQRRQKVHLMNTCKNEIILKHEKEKQDKKQEESEDERIRKFVKAKRKMANMRKHKEQELFDAFQQHTELMRTKLQTEMQQKVDNEDERIAKAVAEREKKRLEEAELKDATQAETLAAIKDHRTQMMDEVNRTLEQNKTKDQSLLKQRIKVDKDFHEKVTKERSQKRSEATKLQHKHKTQMSQKREKKEGKKNEQLDIDRKNTQLLVKEEEIFQKYAESVITDAKKGGRNPFPLIKARQEGPGGGRGPKFEGNAGLRPSYIVADATGVQLPHYIIDEAICNQVYGHVGKSGKRLGFTW